jgi:Icc protein
MSNFALIQISDHHLPERESDLVRGFSPTYTFRAVMRHIAKHSAQHADFILSTGDLVDPCSEAGYQNARRLLGLKQAQSPELFGEITIEGLQNFPMYFMPGNHDERPLFVQHLFRQSAPNKLVNFAFQHKGVQFVCLDMGAAPKAVLYPETLDFLAQALLNDIPTILVTHHHIVPIGSRWLDEFIANDIQELWKLLTAPHVNGKLLGVLSGHTHITYEKYYRGIPVFGLRSTTFSFALQDEPLITLELPHYRLVSLQNGLLTTRIFEVNLS